MYYPINWLPCEGFVPNANCQPFLQNFISDAYNIFAKTFPSSPSLKYKISTLHMSLKAFHNVIPASPTYLRHFLNITLSSSKSCCFCCLYLSLSCVQISLIAWNFIPWIYYWWTEVNHQLLQNILQHSTKVHCSKSHAASILCHIKVNFYLYF